MIQISVLPTKKERDKMHKSKNYILVGIYIKMPVSNDNFSKNIYLSTFGFPSAYIFGMSTSLRTTNVFM